MERVMNNITLLERETMRKRKPAKRTQKRTYNGIKLGRLDVKKEVIIVTCNPSQHGKSWRIE